MNRYKSIEMIFMTSPTKPSFFPLCDPFLIVTIASMRPNGKIKIYDRVGEIFEICGSMVVNVITAKRSNNINTPYNMDTGPSISYFNFFDPLLLCIAP